MVTMPISTVAPAPPSATTAPRVRMRRSVRWLVVGLLLMALGGLGTWALVSQASGSRPVLKLVRTVYRGQAVGAGDFAVAQVGHTGDVSLVSADRLNSLVGQVAQTDIPAGSILVAGSLGAVDLPAGVARVGVKVESGRLPGTTLKPGTRVLAVALPAGQSGGGTPAPLPASVDAEISAPPSSTADGQSVVTLAVPADSAEQVARLAAAKQLVIVERARG